MRQRKSIALNFAFQFMYQVLLTLVPLVTAPYLARTLGAKGVGIYSYHYAVAYYFVLFAKLGIDNYGVKEIAKTTTSDRDLLSERFSELFFSKLAIGTAVLLLYCLYVFIFVQTNKGVAWIFAIYVVSAIIDINWFYVGIEDFKLISLRNIAIKILVTVAIFLFVKSPDDLNIYTLIMVGGTYFLSQFVGWGMLLKKVTIRIPDVRSVAHHIKPLLKLFVPVLSMSIYRQMDKIMLGNMSDIYQVGFYEYTEKIYMVLMCVVSVCGDVGMPRIVSYLAGGEREKAERLLEQFVDFGLCLSVAMSFGIVAIVGKFIPLFYGNEFRVCIQLLRLLSPTIVFLCVSVIIRKEYLIPQGKENIFIQSTFIGAIINLILNALLIPGHAASGAIFATMVTELFVMIYQLVRARKGLHIGKYLVHSIWFLIGGGTMFLILSNIWKASKGTWGVVFCEVLLGIMIYSVFAVVFLAVVYRKEMTRLWKRMWDDDRSCG